MYRKQTDAACPTKTDKTKHNFLTERITLQHSKDALYSKTEETVRDTLRVSVNQIQNQSLTLVTSFFTHLLTNFRALAALRTFYKLSRALQGSFPALGYWLRFAVIVLTLISISPSRFASVLILSKAATKKPLQRKPKACNYLIWIELDTVWNLTVGKTTNAFPWKTTVIN